MASTGTRSKPFRTPRTQAVGGGSGPNPNRSTGADSSKFVDVEGGLDVHKGVPREQSGGNYSDDRDAGFGTTRPSVNEKSPIK